MSTHDTPFSPEELLDIMQRVPFHLQLREHRSRTFVSGGKVIQEATPDELARLRRFHPGLIREDVTIEPPREAYPGLSSATVGPHNFDGVTVGPPKV